MKSATTKENPRELRSGRNNIESENQNFLLSNIQLNAQRNKEQQTMSQPASTVWVAIVGSISSNKKAK